MISQILKNSGFRRKFSPFLIPGKDFSGEINSLDLITVNHLETIEKESKKLDTLDKDKIQSWINYSLDIPDGTYIH
tara:strand:+ start:145 stop:372 length:228 start_codon:yes stop_codon:yes gene_type:complete